MPKISLRKRLEKYEDFYERAFSEADVNKIYKEGGGISYDSFKTESRGRTKNKDYYETMFNRKKVKRKDKLGFEIFKRFFAQQRITQNRAKRIIVRTGYKFQFRGKIYKGGMFVPRAYLARRH